jgi:hypothetical protein
VKPVHTIFLTFSAMKTILSLLLLCAALTVQGQVITFDKELGVYVTYDETTGGSRPVAGTPTACHGHTTSYWLVNVNPFAQKVSINGKMLTVTTPIPTQLATLFSIKAEAQDDLNSTNKQVQEMNNVKAAVAAAVAGAPAAITGLNASLTQLTIDCQAYYHAAEAIDEVLTWEERLLRLLNDDKINTASKMRQALTNAGINPALLASLKADLDTFDSTYHTAEAQYIVTIQAAQAAGDKDKEARIQSALEQIRKDYHELDKIYGDALYDMNQLTRKGIDPAKYVVKSDPLKLKGAGGDADEVAYDVTVGDAPTYTDTFGVGGGVKIDYSVGAVLNFTADSSFSLNSDGKLQARKSAFINPTVSPMLHVHRRQSDSFAWAGTFGINAGFEKLTDIKLGFLLGLSAILGRSQKVIVTSGISFVQVDRLKAQYNLTTSYNDVKDFKIDDVTERALRPSLFLGVSIGISKRAVIKKP